LCSDDLSWYVDTADFNREFACMSTRRAWLANTTEYLGAKAGDVLQIFADGVVRMLPAGLTRWLENLRDVLRPLDFEVSFSEEECDPAVKAREL